MSPKRIAIIGAGVSGLTSIKACLEEGHAPVCFERQLDVGGLWRYTEEEAADGTGSVYNSCVINTSKEMMAFSDYPIPMHYPNFMPHTFVMEYFRSYAHHFDLSKYINFNYTVLSVKPAVDYEENGKWTVSVRNEATRNVVEEQFDGVMVCSGHHCYPSIPVFPGLDKFKGIKLHSHSYRRPQMFSGKSVLIVGVGNSAVDIAVDIGTHASRTGLSSRRGAWIVSRMGPFGLPADALANTRFVFSLPINWLQWLVEKMANFRFDHDNYGIGAQHRALEAHPTINDELPYEIMKGRVLVMEQVSHFEADHVVFTDGSKMKIDAVIFATGYHYKFPFLDESILTIQKNDVDLYKYTFPPHLKHPSLVIVGLVQAIGAMMPIAEIQARWFARLMSGSISLPPEDVMRQQIQKKKEWIHRNYVKTNRHTLETFWIEFMDSIAEEIGCKPDLMALFFKNPWLALRCFFGPCVPAQYRLQGPHSWPQAPQQIQKSFSNMVSPYRIRHMRSKEPSDAFKSFWWFILAFSVVYFVLFHLSTLCETVLGLV